MTYTVIYDGNCNLCSTLVQVLERLDQGQQFRYASMQDQPALDRFGVTAQDCDRGMILIDMNVPEQRWSGSDAAEEIGRSLPLGKQFVQLYRALPGLKWTGDSVYGQVRDNRYTLFGRRSQTYQSPYPCDSVACQSLRSEFPTSESPVLESSTADAPAAERATH